MWILKADFKPGDHAIALEHKISEGVAISRTSMKIAWSNTRGQYPDRFQEGESAMYTADVVYENGRPTADERERDPSREGAGMHARGAGFPQQRYRIDLHLLPFALRRRVLGIDLATGKITVYRKVRRRIQRSGRHLPRRKIHARRVEPRTTRAELELHRHLEAEARTEQPGLHARHPLGRVSRATRRRIRSSARTANASRSSRREARIRLASATASS